jgi:hypothetical protein
MTLTRLSLLGSVIAVLLLIGCATDQPDEASTSPARAASSIDPEAQEPFANGEPSICLALVSGISMLGLEEALAGLEPQHQVGLPMTPGAEPDTVAIWWGDPPVASSDQPRPSERQVQERLATIREWLEANTGRDVRWSGDPAQSACA